MDAAALARDTALFVAPFLPYLIGAGRKAGEKAVEEIGKKVGGAGFDLATAIWTKLRPSVEKRPAAQEAAADVARQPEAEGAQAALRWQLQKLFESDRALQAEVAALMAETAVRADVDVEAVDTGGTAIAVDAERITQADVTAKAKAKIVKGNLIGVRAKTLGG